MSAPGLLWIFLLGGCAYLVGIVGPIVVNPTYSGGPLIGIFITGPIGLVLGVVGYFAMRFFPIDAGRQWFVLGAICVAGSAVTIFLSFPAPVVKAFVVQAEVVSCRAPREVTNEVVDRWQKEVDQVTWATPTAGWREHIINTLQADSGVIVDTRVVRRIGIYEHRKPWNKGTLFTKDKVVPNDSASYYEANATCAQYPNGKKIESLLGFGWPSKGTDADWPPAKLEDFIGRLEFAPVPDAYRALVQ